MAVTAKYDFGIFMTFDVTEDFMFYLYLKPWSRFAAYGVGALLGWVYFEYQAAIGKSKLKLISYQN